MFKGDYTDMEKNAYFIDLLNALPGASLNTVKH